MVWPGASPFSPAIGYDLTDPNLSLNVSLEQISPHHLVYAQTATNLAGSGSWLAPLVVPDPDPADPYYLSSPQGAQYVWHAAITSAGSLVSDASLPVRLAFGVHPTQPLSSALTPGNTYSASIGWEELPSYLSGDALPMDRAALWDSLEAGEEHYSMVLELLDSTGSVISSNSVLTAQGTGSTTFTIKVPLSAKGPFTWKSFAQTATNVLSENVQESFEGYERGANYNIVDQTFTNTNFLAPWVSFSYPQNTDLSPVPPPFTNWLNEGIQLLGSDGSQSAFMVVTNPSWLPYAGFGIFYTFPNGGWALPANTNLWTNYVFSYDFQETHGYACSVDMQIKNNTNHGSGWLEYTRNYPGNGWFTLRASLDKFAPPPPGVSPPFDPNHLDILVLNIKMFTTNVIYLGAFDNIHFTGPETNLGGGDVTSLYTSANDALGWLTISGSANGASVSWAATGVLQSATNLVGPWITLTNATSPFSVGTSMLNQFYRLHR